MNDNGTVSERIEAVRERLHEKVCDTHIYLNKLACDIAELERMERETPNDAVAEAIAWLKDQYGSFRETVKLDHGRLTRALNRAEAKLEGRS
jgi:hypothetical protein